MLVVKDKLWDELVNKVWGEDNLGPNNLCPNCIETILGRKLIFEDLKINSRGKAVPCTVICLFNWNKLELMENYLKKTGGVEKTLNITRLMDKDKKFKTLIEKNRD